MASKMGGISSDDMKKLQKKLNKLQQGEADRFLESCAKELAARLLAKVIKRTPVGVYPTESGKKGGTLRRGWTSKSHEEAASGSNENNAQTAGKSYAESLKVNHVGGYYVVEIINPVEYASYVEYGHRQQPGRYVPAIGKRLKKRWVEGKFMLTISEQEIQKIAPEVLEMKIKNFLKGVM